MRISDWSSDVCSSDLAFRAVARADHRAARARAFGVQALAFGLVEPGAQDAERLGLVLVLRFLVLLDDDEAGGQMGDAHRRRSEEHTSELQSLMRISYAVFCLKKKTTKKNVYMLT